MAQTVGIIGTLGILVTLGTLGVVCHPLYTVPPLPP
jgi:hypothetical protein